MTNAISSVSDTLTLQMLDDADSPPGAPSAAADFTVDVDGQQTGGLQTVAALHSAGKDNTHGAETVAVMFVNNTGTQSRTYNVARTDDRTVKVNYDGQATLNTTPISPPDGPTELGNRVRPPLMVLAASLAAAGPASAHVKWFCAYNVATTPRALNLWLNGDFGRVLALGLVVLTIACVVDRTIIGRVLLAGMTGLGSLLEGQTERMMRGVYGAFFVCLWSTGGIILTPELKTGLGFVPWLQLTIALGLLWRPTMIYSAAGMVVLYAIGLRFYGLFHLLDYPIFLGAAGYMALSAARRTLFGLRPLDVVRWGAAITLMWAAVEKWAYPQWTAPLFVTHPQMAMGFSPDFFMSAAGLVEFSLAFALVWTPLIRRSAAVILTAMFVSAVFEFGKIDAIGHAPIVVVLLAIALDSVPAPERHPIAATAWYTGALAFFIGSYYGVHALVFGPALRIGSRLEFWPAAVLLMIVTGALAFLVAARVAKLLPARRAVGGMGADQRSPADAGAAP